MASRFDIQIQSPNSQPPCKQTWVNIIDYDQNEHTGWCNVSLPAGAGSEDDILAMGFDQHPALASMLESARQVAYAVYLNKRDFDIHGFFVFMQSRRSHSCLQSTTQSVSSTPTSSPRM